MESQKLKVGTCCEIGIFIVLQAFVIPRKGFSSEKLLSLTLIQLSLSAFQPIQPRLIASDLFSFFLVLQSFAHVFEIELYSFCYSRSLLLDLLNQNSSKGFY